MVTPHGGCYANLLLVVGCLRNKTSASASASASAKNSIFWSHVKKRPLALALVLLRKHSSIMRELRLRLQLESLETRGLKVQFSCDMCDPIFCFVQIVSYELVSGDTVRVSVRPQGSTVNRYRFSAVSPQRASRVSRDVPNRLPFSCHTCLDVTKKTERQGVVNIHG
jgi:hypothetical protein